MDTGCFRTDLLGSVDLPAVARATPQVKMAIAIKIQVMVDIGCFKILSSGQFFVDHVYDLPDFVVSSDGKDQSLD